MENKKVKLTPKQKIFCAHFAKTLNATESAREAGYSDKSAGVIGAENLKKPYLLDYIRSLSGNREEKAIASLDDVMQFFTKVMNGEVKDQFELDPMLRDRIEAGKEIKRRYETIESYQAKAENREHPTKVVIVNDLDNIEDE